MAKLRNEADYIVLRVLMAGESYGYAIRRSIRDATGGEVDLRLAAIYDALHRLLEDGLVEPGPEIVVNGRSRRTYEMTGLGQRVLQERDHVEGQLRGLRPRPQATSTGSG